MQQQFRLRLGDGTMLLVDRDARNTWRVDDRAMVQPVGTTRWTSPKRYIADEKAAAFSAPAPAAPAPAPTGNEPPKATRLEDVLVPPPPRAKAGAAPAPAAAPPPLIPAEEP